MAQPAGGGGGQENAENAYTLLWILAGVFIVCGLIWYFWSTQLKWFFIFVRRYETKILSFFVHNENTNILNQGMNMVRPDSLTWDYATKISDFIGGYLMYPSIFILLVLEKK